MEHKCKKSDSKTIEKCELNREQVIKTLEHVKSYGKITQYNAFHIVTNALALIKELTQRLEMLSESYDHLEKTKDELLAEKSRLIEENEELHASCTEFERKCASLNDENERLMRGKTALECIVSTARNQAKADTVRKMQERFSILLKKEYEENTPEGSSFYFKNGSLMMWSIAGRVFDQIAKEMLEE